MHVDKYLEDTKTKLKTALDNDHPLDLAKLFCEEISKLVKDNVYLDYHIPIKERDVWNVRFGRKDPAMRGHDVVMTISVNRYFGYPCTVTFGNRPRNFLEPKPLAKTLEDIYPDAIADLIQERKNTRV